MQTAHNLSKLTLDAAIEIDAIRTGSTREYTKIHELSTTIEPYEPAEKIRNCVTIFSYMSLWRTLQKHEQKEIRWVNELSQEMTKLRKRMENIPHADEDEVKRMISFLCDWTRELYSEGYQPFIYRLVG